MPWGLPEDRLTPVPEGVSDVGALGMILSAVAPYQMLHRLAKLRAGQSLMIHGAGGGGRHGDAAAGAGGRHCGLRHRRSGQARPHPQSGCHAAGSDAPEGALLEATGGGVDAVFDPLGGDSLPRSLHALKPGGMLVAFGFQNEVLGRGGSIPLDFVTLKLWDWLPTGHATAFYSIGAMRRRHPEWFGADLATLFGMLAEGRIAPVVAEVLQLAQVREAHARVEAGEIAGKLVLRVSAP